MDPRRSPRAVSDPKVRHVGFFAPGNVTSSSPPVTNASPPHSNPLSPVVIPPAPRHMSTGALPIAPPHPTTAEVELHGVAFNPSIPPSVNTDFSEDLDSPITSGSTVLAAGRIDLDVVKRDDNKTKMEAQQEEEKDGKSLKEKTTKAERRAIQEAQRAAKAAAKGEGSKNPNVASVKPVKSTPQKKDNSAAAFAVAASDKKSGDIQLPDKDKKKGVLQPRMQFDDENRVEKAKKRSVVKHMDARNRVELFRHLPQYEHGTRLTDLESKFFQLQSVHPSVYKVGLHYLSGDISGGNGRCIAMLRAFQDSIKDYSTPPEKALIRDLASKVNSYVSFLIDCRPLSVSMGNAIKFLKNRIVNLPLNLSESEAKTSLISDIDRYINWKIILASKVIVKHAVTKIRDGDVLLTYALSSTVEMVLVHAHELGKRFRVVIVDSRPKFEGLKLVRRLVGKGIKCTYTHINAVSYVMHEVTRVFLGASSVWSNGMVYSRAGTACVAMVAHQFRVPVLICCEAYKFHNRVQLDSFCFNEPGDPDAVAQVPARKEINYLDGWADSETLQPLNLVYDTTPSDYISMIITDYGMIPPTSVPVIVREYCKEQLWI